MLDRRAFLAALAASVAAPALAKTPTIDGSNLGELDAKAFQALLDAAPPYTKIERCTVELDEQVLVPPTIHIDRCDFRIVDKRSTHAVGTCVMGRTGSPALYAPDPDNVLITNCYMYFA